MRKQHHVGTICLAALWVTALFPVEALAVEALLKADTFLSQTQPEVSFGSTVTLNVSPNDRALIEFDLNSLLPSSITPDQVTKATLFLWVNRVCIPGTVELVDVMSEWNVNTARDSNPPAVGAGLGTVLVSKANQWVTADVTEITRTWQTNRAGNHGLGEGVFEVTLTTTVTSKIEEKTVFLVEVGQAGIFRVQNVPSENMEPLLSIACPNILFPYAREVVSDAVTRAGFAPVLLQPVNFEALYMSRLQQQEAAKEAAGEATTH